ncbi:MAG: VWD domain-containing protein [Bradymonadaceae bacterium]|nr:VWD domain-containing protein [Lujinxingiaceae bacterium]
MRHRPSHTPSLNIATLLLVASCAAASLNCSDSPTADAPGAPHTLSGSACTDPITASFAANAAVKQQSGVAHYAMSLSGDGLNVALTDVAAKSLGRLQIDLELDISPETGLLEQWRVSTALVEGNQRPASQSLRGREIGKGRLWFEIVHRAGEHELIQWAVVGSQPEPHSHTIAVVIDADADPGVQGRLWLPDGRLVEVLELLDASGKRIEQARIDAWIEARLGGAFTEHTAWQRLIAVGNDRVLWEGADAHTRLCQAASLDGLEEALIVRQQAQCTDVSDDDELQQTRQAQCTTDQLVSGLQTVLAVDDAITALTGGGAIAGALIAAGVITTGPAIGAVVIGGAIGIILVSGAIDRAVDNNKGAIFSGAGYLGSKVTGGDDGGQAFADFFGGSSGDPHFDTFDGMGYGFQGAGEYVLVEAVAGSAFLVQVRHEPIGGMCPNVAITTAVTTRMGARRVAFYAGRENPLYIDGVPTQLPGGLLALDGGGSIERSSDQVFELRWPAGERMQVKNVGLSAGAGLLNLRMALPEHRRGQVRGLLGNYNGDPDDDIAPRGDLPLAAPVDWVALNEVFGESWRVEAAASLFDYAEGEDASSFVVEGFPARPTVIEDLTGPAREQAERACTAAGIDNEVAFNSCVMDVACTGNIELAQSHTDRQPKAELALLLPIFLDGWAQQGDLVNGTWVVADNGRSVEQLLNGDPSFFVSVEDYHGVTIRGMFRTDDRSDDDFIGFVFGYRSPIEARGDDPQIYDTFVLSWKAAEQDYGGNLGLEGFALSHLKGEMGRGDYEPLLWGHRETPVHRVIATNFGAGLGWRAETQYPFELTYTDEQIVIVIGGEEIFRVQAAESAVPFAPGRFGFYNYSQARVNYGQFTSGRAEQDPTASLAGLEYGVARIGDDYEHFEMDTADPRLCRQACLQDVTCQAFTYQRPVYYGVGPYCWLKDRVPPIVEDAGFISGVR